MKLNSERIPNKNFKTFAGRPLFEWILSSLLGIDSIDSIVINTDAKQKLLKSELVQSDRVIIKERKSSLCGDHVSMNKIIFDDISSFPASTYLMTHTTNPLLMPATIQQAITRYKTSSEHDSLFTVNKHQTRFYREDCSPINHDPNNLVPTQDLEPWFEENSCLYIFNRDSFLSTQARIGSRPQLMIMSKAEACDIDVPDDWAIAEALAKVSKLQ